MQEQLFSPHGVEINLDLDPYEGQRESARDIATGFGISEESAFDLILAYGSERAARAVLKQRWWRGEIERLDNAA